ncbi:type I-F CRISPR-associated protein Csy3 [Vibrio aestuarianus]|uniref:type I-F CRISPR-associated protein Csy3 n=1 Tax=Vibrio aestuarianus TaxID=28171 RepID=UPI00237CB74D|nr:type I-F CRISPR-associated protein Csy3 [Vibrio aestuarianus]MDE1264558.1 type I-F CRISPR-associated protein Csy3 [Vibrio aestuarianus]MDE1296625.1 type I-F CRISPR-associated protein Csy3 [Vibrio aestuarianus]
MELCNQLSYVRSLSPGKAYFYYLDDNKKMAPLKIDRTRLRAPKSGYAEAYSGDFQQKNVAPQDLAFSNPQFIEECYVPPGVDNIYCAFSLRIKANSLFPDVCADSSIRLTLATLAKSYKELGGYQELAKRYAKNILMATWVWRNRECRNIEVEVRTEKDQWRIADARRLEWNGSWDSDSLKSLNGLTEYLTQALSDRSHYFNMDVKAKLSVGWGDEVYPSQEFLDTKEQGKPTKQLATTELYDGEKTAAYHKQKVGAAIQLIDDWWDECADKTLRVNEYGADQQYVIARRHSSMGHDFYSLLRNTGGYIDQMKSKQSIPNEVHYMMAVLAKGGLFNGASKKSKKSKKEQG